MGFACEISLSHKAEFSFNAHSVFRLLIRLLWAQFFKYVSDIVPEEDPEKMRSVCHIQTHLKHPWRIVQKIRQKIYLNMNNSNENNNFNCDINQF